MPLDVEKYRCHVHSIDLPEDRKDELIRIVYSILEAFADAAFGVHPVQLSLGSLPQKVSKSLVPHVIVDGNSNSREAKKSVGPTTEEKEIP